jgi:hypothetical protein
MLECSDLSAVVSPTVATATEACGIVLFHVNVYYTAAILAPMHHAARIAMLIYLSSPSFPAHAHSAA